MEETVRSPRLIRFGTFELDPQSGELRKSGLKLKLTGLPFQVLAILLEHPGAVVTREELQKRLWPDTFVDVDHSLNTSVNKIREVLGDSAENPRFVETLPRRGYRFIAPIEGAEPTPTACATTRQVSSCLNADRCMRVAGRSGFLYVQAAAKFPGRRCSARSRVSLLTTACRLEPRGHRTAVTSPTVPIAVENSTFGFSR